MFQTFSDYRDNKLSVTGGIGVGVGFVGNVSGAFDKSISYGSSPIYGRWGFAIPAEQSRGVGVNLPAIIGSVSEHRMADDSMIQAWMREVMQNPSYVMTKQDRLDVELCAIGNQNIYDAMVLSWVQNGGGGDISTPSGGPDPKDVLIDQLKQQIARYDQRSKEDAAAYTALSAHVDNIVLEARRVKKSAKVNLTSGGGGIPLVNLRALLNAIQDEFGVTL